MPRAALGLLSPNVKPNVKPYADPAKPSAKPTTKPSVKPARGGANAASDEAGRNLPKVACQSPSSRPASSASAPGLALGFLGLSTRVNGELSQLQHDLFEAEMRCMNERLACNAACERASSLSARLELAREASEAARHEVGVVQRALDDSRESCDALTSRLIEARAAGEEAAGLHEALAASRRAEEELRVRLAELETTSEASLDSARSEAAAAKREALEASEGLAAALQAKQAAEECAKRAAASGVAAHRGLQARILETRRAAAAEMAAKLEDAEAR